MGNLVVSGGNLMEAAGVVATHEVATLPAANLTGPLYRPYRSGPHVGPVDLSIQFPRDEPEQVGFLGLLDHTLGPTDTVTGFAYGPPSWHGDRFTRMDELVCEGSGHFFNQTPSSIAFERWTGTVQPPGGGGVVASAVWFEIWELTPYQGGIVGAMVAPHQDGAHQAGFVLNGDAGLVLHDFTGTLNQCTWRPRVGVLPETAAGPFDVGGGVLTRWARERLPRHLFLSFPTATVEALWLRIDAADTFDIGGLHVAAGWAGEGREPVTVKAINPNQYQKLPGGRRVLKGGARQRLLRELEFAVSPTDLDSVLTLQQLAAFQDGPVCVGVFEDRAPAVRRFGWVYGYLKMGGVDEGAGPGWATAKLTVTETTGGAR